MGVGEGQYIVDLRKIKTTKPLSFRVPLYVWHLYKQLDDDGKALLKDILIHVIESGKLDVNVQQQKVVNLNINVNRNEVRPQIDVSAGDPELAREYVRTLKEELQRAKEIIRRRSEEVKRLRAVLRKVKIAVDTGNCSAAKKLLQRVE